MAFIGDGRLLLSEGMEPDPGASEIPNLVLLDASVPEASSAKSRDVRFVCDPRRRGMSVKVMAEEAGWSDPSGVIGQDVPFYPDPSQRVIALMFHGADAPDKAQSICVVRPATLLRLAREQGGGVVEWDAWEKFAVTLDMDEVSRPRSSTKFSISGSRFVMVDTNETEGWAKIRMYDLSHWSRQHPCARRLYGGGKPDGKKVQCRLTEAILELPEDMCSVRHAVMVQDSVVFFSVSLPVRCV